LADSEDESDSASYQPAMDLDCFRQLIRDAEQEHSHDAPRVKENKKFGASTLTRTGMYSVVHKEVEHTYRYFA